MGTIASQITSLTIVYSGVYSNADQSKHQSSASLAFVREIHRGRWISRTNGQWRGKCFHLMTSSWHIVLRQINRIIVDVIFKGIFLNGNFDESPKCTIKNITALVQTMAWPRSGHKPLSESMMTYFTYAYMCVSQPQWVDASTYPIYP